MLRILLLSIFLSSCATIHKGKFAKQLNKENKKESEEVATGYYYQSSNSSKRERQTDSGLLVSYGWNKNYEDKYFKCLEFTFENNSKEWRKIDKIGITFDKITKSNEIFFLNGAPLASFLKAKELAIAVQARNAAAFAGVMAGVAASAGARNNDYNNFNTGLIAMSIANNMEKNIKSAINQYPEEHLFGSKDKFLIPPNLAITKYLVFYTKDNENFKSLDKLFLTYELKNGKKETLEMSVGKQFY